MAVAILDEQGGIPRVVQVVVGDGEIEAAERADGGEVPDLGLTGPEGNGRVDLAVDALLPALVEGRIVSHPAVVGLQFEDVTPGRHRLDVDRG